VSLTSARMELHKALYDLTTLQPFTGLDDHHAEPFKRAHAAALRWAKRKAAEYVAAIETEEALAP